MRRAFLAPARPAVTPSPPSGVLSAGPARDDGIINVPGGLVHHWRAAAFIRGATLRQGLDVSSAFANYHAVYKAVIRSKLLGRNGDKYTVLMRLEEGETGVRAVLDVRSTVEYVYIRARESHSRSHTPTRSAKCSEPDVRTSGCWNQVATADTSGVPPTFTYFREQPEGLYVETETTGLSREFPPLLGWIIEPIARGLGRRSVATSLQEFAAAIQEGAS